jgi:hypothetical protein
MSRELGERGTTRRSLRMRPTSALHVATGVVAVFVAMLIVSSVASASPVAFAKRASKTLKAPYAGAPASEAEWNTLGCGAKGSVPITPTFNTSSGALKASASASVKSCGSVNSSAYAVAIGGLESTASFTTGTGKYTVTVDWSVKINVSLAATTGGKGQRAEAFAVVEGIAELFDAKNNSYLDFAANLSGFLNSSTPTTHTYSYKFSLSATLNLVAKNTYSVETYVEVLAAADVTPGASSASASINMGSSGNQGKLTSIVIP